MLRCTAMDQAYDYTYIICIRVEMFSATSRNKILKWVVEKWENVKILKYVK